MTNRKKLCITSKMILRDALSGVAKRSLALSILAALVMSLPLSAHADDTLTVDTTTVEARYQYHFLNAIAQYSAGRTDTARVMLEQCRSIRPDAAETYFYLAKCYDADHNDSLRTVMIQKAAELQPENVTYKEALIPIHLSNNEIEKATALAEDIVAHTPERTDMLDLLLQIYQYQKDNERSLQTLDRIAVQEGDNERIAMAKIQIYNAMGDERRARKTLDALVSSHPLDLDYRVMRGNWYLRKGKKKEALNDYRAVLKEEPENESAMLSMMDYYRSERLDSLADNERERLLLSPKTRLDTKVFLIKQFIRASEQASVDSTVVLNLFSRMLQQKQSDTTVKELQLAYMQMKNMPKDTIKSVLQSLLDERPEHSAARFQLIQMAAEAKDYTEMARLAKPALQYNPDVWAFAYFLGMAYYFNDDYEACAKVLNDVSGRVDEKNDKDLATQMYGLLGDTLHKLGRNGEAFKAYDNCLRISPDDKSVLNNYAYYLSEEGRDLDRAAAMSLKTVKEEPNNATFLDTYAWILYLQGRYEEAKIYIDMAVKNLDPDEDNTTITDHQKDIYKRLGMKPEPVKQSAKDSAAEAQDSRKEPGTATK